MDASARRWAKEVADQHKEARRIGYYGSYARGDWGVGGDLDLIVILNHTDDSALVRGIHFDLTGLPVPTDVIVFTEEEWAALDPSIRFHWTLQEETVWVWGT